MISSPFSRHLDDSYDGDVRRHLDTLTFARLATNACYRFVPPFIATIAADFDVSVTRIGVALAVGEIAGLFGPLIGRAVDRMSRRAAMLCGGYGLAAAVVLAGASRSLAVLAVALVALSASKILLDSATVAWINDRVPYEARGRVVGILETSWALGLLVGVASMGVVTQFTNWRIGFGSGALVTAILTTAIAMRMPAGGRVSAGEHHEHVPFRAIGIPGLHVIGTMFLLMAASQSVSVTFGPWMSDEFGSSDLAISAVVFGLGAVELLASITAARRVDVWGKERSVTIGALCMVPVGALMVVGAGNLMVGLALLIAFIGFFEFAVVTVLPVAANLVPGRTGIGLGIAVGAGTLGRAAATPVATAIYEDGPGFGAATMFGAACALVTVGLMARYRAITDRPSRETQR